MRYQYRIPISTLTNINLNIQYHHQQPISVAMSNTKSTSCEANKQTTTEHRFRHSFKNHWKHNTKWGNMDIGYWYWTWVLKWHIDIRYWCRMLELLLNIQNDVGYSHPISICNRQCQCECIIRISISILASNFNIRWRITISKINVNMNIQHPHQYPISTPTLILQI